MLKAGGASLKNIQKYFLNYSTFICQRKYFRKILTSKKINLKKILRGEQNVNINKYKKKYMKVKCLITLKIICDEKIKNEGIFCL